MDSFEKAWDWASDALDGFKEFWEAFTWRERIWVGGTIAATAWGSLFGGALVTGAMLTGGITCFGFMWITTYSTRVIELAAKYRKWLDVGISLPCLFAPLVLGAQLGLLVVFANLYITTSLIFLVCYDRMGGLGEERVIDVEAIPAAATA